MSDVIDFPEKPVTVFSCPQCGNAFWLIHTDWLVECAFCGNTRPASEMEE